MPRLPIDYSKTIIYKLCCLDTDITDIYIGNTTDFIKRKSEHKQSCYNKNKRKCNTYKYQFIREHGGWDNWQMIQIEEYLCKNKREAESRETYWMKELKSTLNLRQSFTTKEEKIQNQKEYIKKNNENWKEYYKEYHKEYRKKNNENWKEYHKEYHKIWYKQKTLYLNELKCYNI